MNNDDKDVIINFNYKSKLVTIKTNPFKELEEIKKLAIKKMKIMNNINLNQEELNCYYLGRNLKEYEHQKICELFSNRQTITIKLISPKNQLTIDLGNGKLNNNFKNNNIKTSNISSTPNPSPIRGKNYFTNFNKNINVFSSGFNSISRIKKVENSAIHNLFLERLKNKNYLLPMINIKNSKNNLTFSNKKEKTEEDDNCFIPSKKELYNISICGKCNENYINEYCRTCNEFICSECKENNEHKNHLTIHLIKDDLNDNINIYGNLVQIDIDENINNNNELLKIDKIIDIIDQKIWIGKNNDIIHKLEDLIKIYQNILDILKNLYTKEYKSRMNELIKNFEKGANNINEEINQLLNNINSQNIKQFNFNEFKSYFEKINNSEVKLFELNQDLIKYHLGSEINNKVNYIYSKINKVLDDAVDIKNLFNLEPKYYNELIKIINFDKKRFNKIYKTNKLLDYNFSEENSKSEDEKKNNNEKEEKNEKIGAEKKQKNVKK